MSNIECEACDGTGAIDYVGFSGVEETETCVKCDGTGNRDCDGCNSRATHCVTKTYEGSTGALTLVDDYFCDYCDPRILIRGAASGKT